MTQSIPAREGGQVLADQLVLHGVDTVFAVPGESYLPVLEGLHANRNRVKLITCRMEAGAANMADAYGKLTGKPGICMVTRGPGATHASVGVHTASQDSTPMILFVGQIGRDMKEREAFQEVDYKAMFGSIAKWVVEIDDPLRIPELIARAFAVATSGRPGPVVIALPEDVLSTEVDVADARAYRSVQPSPSAADMTEFAQLLARAERPLVIAGGSTWTPQACADLVAFAENNGVPVAAAFRTQDIFPNQHPLYVGDIGVAVNPKLLARVKEADLIIALGTRLEETVTQGYTAIAIPAPAQRLVHIHPSSSELGRVYQADLPINSGMPQFVAMAKALPAADASRLSAWSKAARSDYEASQQPVSAPGAVNMSEIVSALSKALPDDAIVTNGAGNYAVWVHRFHRYRAPRTQLAPTSGAMGYGVPAAVAAKALHPERTVVSFNGDGCFLMCGQELATAVQHGLDPIFIVVNNGMYGTIRMHQERHYPGNVWGTELKNPDFVALAKAYGCHAELVDATADFMPAFERAKQAGRAALIEIRVDPEALTPRQTLSEIRKAGEAANGGV
jgi:acetolactate synthase-1/2/3 large subunit